VHRILRQVVEVEVQGGESAALALQRVIADLCREAAAARLEAALTAFDPGDALLVIDRLTVDLGDVGPELLEAALTQRLPSAVAAGLRDRGWTVGARPTGGELAPALSPTEALLEAVLHFLRRGRLPWWYSLEEGRSLEERFLAVLASGLDGGRAEGAKPGGRRPFPEALAQALRADARARERLLLQFSPATLLAVLDLLDPERHRLLWRVLRSSRMPASGRLRHRMEASLIEVALHAVVGASPAKTCATEDALFRTAAARLGSRLPEGERDAIARLAPLPISVVDPFPTPVPPPAPDEGVVEEGLPVEDAGLVLLHPFLPRFLELLGTAGGDALLRPSRAALLLHHLATGALTAEEHALVLAKVLCGLPIEAALPRESPVTPEEGREAVALLESVVRHWAVLRGTSADGLRGNFLARSGRLELRDGDWLLRVERRPHDVLLESLPWGIGHVKLPWMPRLMHVEWAP